MAKNNIFTVTKELVKELNGDVPEGKMPAAHNGVIHTSLKGVGGQGFSHTKLSAWGSWRKASTPMLGTFTGMESSFSIDNQS